MAKEEEEWPQKTQKEQKTAASAATHHSHSALRGTTSGRSETMIQNIYIALTNEFNAGRLRAVICSGQAAVLHRIAIMSKDGDWIIREDEEACQHILRVLTDHGATCRFGAPLDPRWLRHGWSSHFEFHHENLRIRTDFFTRPPRISAASLEEIWEQAAKQTPPFISKTMLAEMKKTDREKDYAVIGELAKRLQQRDDILLYSRSARDLIAISEGTPIPPGLVDERPLLAALPCSVTELERELDAERRALMHANEDRLARYAEASRQWAAKWPELQKEIAGKQLEEAHAICTAAAEGVLPFSPYE